MNKKLTFVSWKWGLFFFKKGNPIFSIKFGQRLPKSFSQLHVKHSRFFLSYFLKNKRLAQGIRRPKAAGSPLPQIYLNFLPFFGLSYIPLNFWTCFHNLLLPMSSYWLDLDNNIMNFALRQFKTAHEVYLHVCEAHCPTSGDEILCLWASCDGLKRRRFSLMTHLYDRHCNPEVCYSI